jgi:L-ribulose-5-phosphate 3-epimerase
MADISRKEFIVCALGSALASQANAAKPPESRFVKGICRAIFPASMPLDECFRQARNAGFDAIELPMVGELAPTATRDVVKAVGERARKAGVAIGALWVSELGSSPLNSPDVAIRARGVEAIRRAVEFAGYLNCEALLVVPCRVGSGAKFFVGYETTWERTSAELKKAIPFAEEAKILLAIENVSNRFLVSPLEMRSFVDQFRSPWVQSFFDIGNVMYFGYPQDWILTLGPRIKRVHAKDRKATPGAERGAVGLLDGDVDWKAVMAALVKVGYRGTISPEIGYDAGDQHQLKKVSSALDKILALA